MAMGVWMAVDAAMLGGARRMDGDRRLNVDGDGRVYADDDERLDVDGDGRMDGGGRSDDAG